MPRDAAERLAARLRNQDSIGELIGDSDSSPKLSASALHPLVWKSASAQWSTGHRQEAVLAAAKAVNSLLQDRVGRRDVSEVALVREAFSDSAPGPARSRLHFPDIQDAQTRESMRQGVMSFGVGCFQAIRNPVGHLPNEQVELTEQEALERPSSLSLFARWIEEAELITA